MSEHATVNESAMQAYYFAAKQLWDTRYGVVEAFKVDTGQCLDWAVKPWEQLTVRERWAFTAEIKPVLLAMNVAAREAGLA